MYLQITSRCNMSCAHCCMKATAKGQDMTPRTFRAAVQFAVEQDATISLGGGEPTIHPRFWEFLGLAIGSVEYVWLATNGSQTDTAIALAKLARKGVIGCALSQDPWHDSIDERVVKAFTKGREIFGSPESHDDAREVRNVSGDVEKMSPWRDPEDGGDPNKCPCEELFVKPNGDVHMCGCPDSPKIGTVFAGIELPEDYESHTCYKHTFSVAHA